VDPFFITVSVAMMVGYCINVDVLLQKPLIGVAGVNITAVTMPFMYVSSSLFDTRTATNKNISVTHRITGYNENGRVSYMFAVLATK
jgi:hypothetical protein